MHIELQIKYCGKKGSFSFSHPRLKKPIRFGGPGSTVWLMRKDALFLNSLSIFELTGEERIISEPLIELSKPETAIGKLTEGIKMKSYQKIKTVMANLREIIKTAKSFEHLKETVGILNELKVEKDLLQGQLAELNKRIPGLLLAQDMVEITSKEVTEAKREIVEIQKRLSDIPGIQEDLGKVKKQQDIFLSKLEDERAVMQRPGIPERLQCWVRNKGGMLKDAYRNLKLYRR